MNDQLKRFIKNVADSRQLVINSGGRPDTLKISKQAIEELKLFGMDIEVVEPEWLPEGVEFMVIEEGATKIEHEHEWLIRFNDIRYRDIERMEYVIDIYQCSCGAGGEVKTPLEVWKKGNKKLGIEEFHL